LLLVCFQSLPGKGDLTGGNETYALSLNDPRLQQAQHNCHPFPTTANVRHNTTATGFQQLPMWIEIVTAAVTTQLPLVSNNCQ
jgi:hypothetical protein